MLQAPGCCLPAAFAHLCTLLAPLRPPAAERLARAFANPPTNPLLPTHPPAQAHKDVVGAGMQLALGLPPLLVRGHGRYLRGLAALDGVVESILANRKAQGAPLPPACLQGALLLLPLPFDAHTLPGCRRRPRGPRLCCVSNACPGGQRRGLLPL